jgi:hypothetical protein
MSTLEDYRKAWTNGAAFSYQTQKLNIKEEKVVSKEDLKRHYDLFRIRR